jgi:hypothetical protein
MKADVHTPQTSVHWSLDDVVATLNAEGAQRLNADGGHVIQAFLRDRLVTEITSHGHR